MRKPGATGPGRCRVDRTAEGTWRRHNWSGSQASPDAEFSPLRRLGEGLAPSRLAPAPFEDAEPSRLRHLIETTRRRGLQSAWPRRRRWSTRLRRARRDRRHATSASSLRSDLFRRRRRSPPDLVLQASILSPTHRPGGACRGRAERRHAPSLQGAHFSSKPGCLDKSQVREQTASVWARNGPDCLRTIPHTPGDQLAAAGRNHLHMASFPGLGGATKPGDSLTQTTTGTVGQWYEFAPKTGPGVQAAGKSHNPARRATYAALGLALGFNTPEQPAWLDQERFTLGELKTRRREDR
jgi:hypothetical protein